MIEPLSSPASHLLPSLLQEKKNGTRKVAATLKSTRGRRVGRGRGSNV
uniref:Uncharacterized protein n=1 Tax=Rhizophora mucronata TaxID=61149 RepID=A0A2P2IP47_RHIMU